MANYLFSSIYSWLMLFILILLFGFQWILVSPWLITHLEWVELFASVSYSGFFLSLTSRLCFGAFLLSFWRGDFWRDFCKCSYPISVISMLLLNILIFIIFLIYLLLHLINTWIYYSLLFLFLVLLLLCICSHLHPGCFVRSWSSSIISISN